MSTGVNANIITVDWGPLSNPASHGPLDYALGYVQSLQYVVPVGQRIGAFISRLVAMGFTTYDQIHLVGHSVGAHVAGAAGLAVRAFTLGQNCIYRITGLDPAGPLFFPLPLVHKLTTLDASFVDVIHTNLGMRGDVLIDGDADFYRKSPYYIPISLCTLK